MSDDDYFEQERKRQADELAEIERGRPAEAGFVHLAGEFDRDSLIQRCTICGGLLSDYRNAAWPEGSPPPVGWEPGPVTVGPNGRGSQWLAVGRHNDYPDCTP